MLRLGEVERPVPGDDEILVKVHAVSVNRSDWEGLTGTPAYARMAGLRRPKYPILGSDVAGRVEAAGRSHTAFAPGDEVFGEMWEYRGGFAEYVRTPARGWAKKPAALTFEQAAAIPQAGVIALQGLRGRIQPGQRVLINGAGGGAGAFAIQLARLYGAEVTGVDNAGKAGFMRSLGAHHVLDYAREDFTRAGERHDLILDLIAERSAFAYARALRSGGSYFCVGGSLGTFLQVLLLGPLIRRTAGKTLRVLVVRRNREDLEAVTQLCASGTIAVPVQRTFPLGEVPEALRQLGEGRVQGKVVITV